MTISCHYRIGVHRLEHYAFFVPCWRWSGMALGAGDALVGMAL
jgi:hypothetical protein